jgi:hypothetical protein
MIERYEIVIAKVDGDDEWVAACVFGSEAPDSPMAGGAAYGRGATALEAVSTVIDTIGMDHDYGTGEVALEDIPEQELPGMWSKSDFEGGDTDSRSYAQRARDAEVPIEGDILPAEIYSSDDAEFRQFGTVSGLRGDDQ